MVSPGHKRAADDSILEDRHFLWASAAIAEERDASQNVLKRFYASGVQVPGATATNDQKLFYTKDHLGSIRELIDPTGTVRARYDFDPYGARSDNLITTNALEADFGYTGHFYLEKADLYLTYFRAYNPNTGRWLSRDPIAEEGGVNLYKYTNNNPVMYLDILGLASLAAKLTGPTEAKVPPRGTKRDNPLGFDVYVPPETYIAITNDGDNLILNLNNPLWIAGNMPGASASISNIVCDSNGRFVSSDISSPYLSDELLEGGLANYINLNLSEQIEIIKQLLDLIDYAAGDNSVIFYTDGDDTFIQAGDHIFQP